MEQVSFRDKITALRHEFVVDRYNSSRSEDFWYVMDTIKDQDILKWAERASKVKSPIGEPWNPSEWTQLCNIIHYMNTYDKFNELPWTKAQKRFCVFMIIKFWDDLEMSYYC